MCLVTFNVPIVDTTEQGGSESIGPYKLQALPRVGEVLYLNISSAFGKKFYVTGVEYFPDSGTQAVVVVVAVV